MKRQRATWLALAAGALFTAGWWTARSTHSHPTNAPTSFASVPIPQVKHVTTDEGGDTKIITANPAQHLPYELIVAMQGELPSRTPALLSALEKVADKELTPEMLAAMEKILAAGDREECQYLISLLEQREEVASVNFLIKQLEHRDKEVRDRALMACEAVAGQVFQSSDEAVTWSRTWQPDPQRQQISSGQPSDDSAPMLNRPGTRKKLKKNETESAEGIRRLPQPENR